MAGKVDYIVNRALQEVKEGKCVVIGLQSTGEAITNELIKISGADTVDEFSEPARGILTQTISSLLSKDRRRHFLIKKANALTFP